MPALRVILSSRPSTSGAVFHEVPPFLAQSICCSLAQRQNCSGKAALCVLEAVRQMAGTCEVQSLLRIHFADLMKLKGGCICCIFQMISDIEVTATVQ